jgi:E3 ubiquitin-protein ligase DOA10
MTDCLICFESGAPDFDGDYRPDACTCKYSIHESCYQNWLKESGDAFNCIICHRNTTQNQARLLNEIVNRRNQAPKINISNLIYILLILYFVIAHLRELVLLGLLSLILYVRI